MPRGQARWDGRARSRLTRPRLLGGACCWLRSCLGPRLHDRPHREQGDDHDDLAPEDDPVDVDRGPPAQLAVPDHECPDRAGAHAEAAARTLAPAFCVLAAAASRAAADPGGGDDRHAVLLVRLAEHPLDGEHIPRLRDDVLNLHRLLPSVVPHPARCSVPCPAPYDDRSGTARPPGSPVRTRLSARAGLLASSAALPVPARSHAGPSGRPYVNGYVNPSGRGVRTPCRLG